jgi:hypothetical protein
MLYVGALGKPYTYTKMTAWELSLHALRLTHVVSGAYSCHTSARPVAHIGTKVRLILGSSIIVLC